MSALGVNERFDAKVDRGDGNGCWLWTGCQAHGRGGYGKFKTRSYVQVRAHRFAYERAYGPLAAGLFVCHHCDNPRCVRPDHLFMGTALENNRDMFAKGRHPNCHGRERTPRTPRVVTAAKPQRTPRTHCKNGHEFTPQNTYSWRPNHRFCRECHRLTEIQRRATKRAS